MATRGRPKAELVLTGEERETLERWARRPTSAQALAQRCRIVLACAQGLSNQQVAAAEGVNQVTVGKWRARFAARRLDGLHDEPRPGAPRTISDADVERVLVKTLEEAPRDATHWSTRSLAAQVGMSQSAVSRIWRAFGLKPHQLESFKLSNDPQFIEKVRDIVGLYLNPPDAAVVLCACEKTQVQALDRTAPILPLLLGTPARATHDYRRHGTTNLYAALDVASGCVISDLTERHRSEEFRRFLNLIDRSVPAGLEVHVVVDNSSLSLVERWFAELTERWLRRGTHRSTRELVASIRTWITGWKENPRPFVWHKTSDEILESLASYCERISDSGH